MNYHLNKRLVIKVTAIYNIVLYSVVLFLLIIAFYAETLSNPYQMRY